jgi:hypothetical protein
MMALFSIWALLSRFKEKKQISAEFLAISKFQSDLL